MGKSGTDGARSLQLLKALLSDTIITFNRELLKNLEVAFDQKFFLKIQ